MLGAKAGAVWEPPLCPWLGLPHAPFHLPQKLGHRSALRQAVLSQETQTLGVVGWFIGTKSCNCFCRLASGQSQGFGQCVLSSSRQHGIYGAPTVCQALRRAPHRSPASPNPQAERAAADYRGLHVTVRTRGHRRARCPAQRHAAGKPRTQF